MADKKTATFVRKLTGWRGDAALYRMDPPHEGSEYVIASAVDLNYGDSVPATFALASCETYLFPADEDGDVVEYTEMDGSLKGVKDHEDALNAAGYEVTR